MHSRSEAECHSGTLTGPETENWPAAAERDRQNKKRQAEWEAEDGSRAEDPNNMPPSVRAALYGKGQKRFAEDQGDDGLRAEEPAESTETSVGQGSSR